MRYFEIQTTGSEIISASRIILGTTHFGTRISEVDTYRIINEFAETGGNAIDTARVYGDWANTGNAASERVVGKWLKDSGKRSEFVLITKGAHHRISRPIVPRVNPKCIREDIELSLKNVDTYIDLYLLHRDDPTVPVSDIMPVLDEYVKRGDIRAIGCSNWTVERKNEANVFAEENGLAGFAASEIQWSLAHIDKDMLHTLFDNTVLGVDAGEYPKYVNTGFPLLAFTSIAWGYFAKVLEGKKPYSDVLNTKENLRRAEIVREWVAQTGKSATAISVAYITSHPFINGASLVGASNPEQVRDFMTAADLVLPQAFFDQF